MGEAAEKLMQGVARMCERSGYARQAFTVFLARKVRFIYSGIFFYLLGQL